ncbi:preprotein translocase subunit SecG [bacterium]|mgnify:CR=1 FL=1|jgi:preprotein translocase subunit SecG|nr:preprotein translocase subunit SecG [bacterium]
MKTFLLIVELLSGLALIGAILLHAPKGEGLGSIGGQAKMFKANAGGLESGLNKVTYVLATVFLSIATVLGLFY